ncbi:helix-turn-helix transcriptional regulator [Actinomadura sp. WMMB 499]|uniref:helix-turn-helix domain-containing protein n=1 Tax=Actinomadura sp. WMMB 499 TaxID=1219491 RepID=UPI00124839A0|nr:helix-turn-helix transcriptional regulator [Actinomadura sp. WMMB 499]QFG21530.1 helix-turn-helix domain-containing protein [Actinomadura sp. WMMB 499]
MGENSAREFFGTELRRRRDEAKLTARELGDALGCTSQWISTMECGRKTSEQSALDLDTYFKTDGMFHRIWEHAKKADRRTLPPPGFPEYAEREKHATSIRIYSALLLTGLFQTERYAATVMGATENDDATEFVAERMERQSILNSENRPKVWLTIEENVLRRPTGGADVMREQLASLLKVSDHPDVMMDVIPRSVAYHPGLEGSFTLLGFDNGTNIAYTESAGTGMLIEQPARVVDYVVRYDTLRGFALPFSASRALITEVMESL